MTRRTYIAVLAVAFAAAILDACGSGDGNAAKPADAKVVNRKAEPARPGSPKVTRVMPSGWQTGPGGWSTSWLERAQATPTVP